MWNPTTILLTALSGLAIAFAVAWWRRLRLPASPGIEAAAMGQTPTVPAVAVGALTNFFDTLGVGSFAPTTWFFRTFGLVPDRLLPGTLNVGHALPSVVQALVFIATVEVDALTLSTMIGAAVAGGWVGATRVATWSRQRVQRGMGLALLVAGGLMLSHLLIGGPSGAEASGLRGLRLVVGIAANLVLGALMTAGVGLYAPCMILVTLLGMNVRAAFPIMMGSCAFLMPVAGLRFIDRGAYAPRVALGLTLGGIPAVLVAAFVVRSLPLDALRWLVVGLALYTASSLLRAARV